MSGSALIVGAGGLGSPAALYLAAAGVGCIGIVDQDVVELSNLHRQIIHAEARVGTHKAESAAQACLALNSSIKVCGLAQAQQVCMPAETMLGSSAQPIAGCIQLSSRMVASMPLQVDIHKQALTAQNALDLISQYDVVLDCTDNAPTRYLISDACVVNSKPLVSGAAIGTDGQLTVYNHGNDGMAQSTCIVNQQTVLNYRVTWSAGNGNALALADALRH